MPRFSREAYDRMLTVRVTAEQDELLEALARRLQLPGKADVVRAALDLWMEQHAQDVAAVETELARDKAKLTKGKARPGPKD